MISLPSPAIGDRFTVRVKPNAGKDEVISCKDGVLLVAIKAPADKGKANARLVKFLSKELGGRVRIKSGLASKEKVLVFV